MQQKEFAKRRKQLMRMMGKGSIAILPAAVHLIRNRDVHYPYRQDSDFYYLTGFQEPEAIMVLLPGRKKGEYLLFNRKRDPEKEIWDGLRAGQKGAKEEYGADESFPIEEADERIAKLLNHCERVFYSMGSNPDMDKKMMEWVNQIRAQSRAGQRAPEEFVSLEHFVHDMRLYKSPDELRDIKKAMAVSTKAHRRAMAWCKPGRMEYEMEAEILYEFNQAGCETAYTSIVGSGANGCILHYIENHSRLVDDTLLLIDAGAEFGCYAADITRTFPVNGKFTPAQKALYEIVLEAQSAAIAKVKPGNHWNDPHEAAVKVITKGLVSEGLLKGKVPQLIKDGAYRKFYMHRTGHWLGLDVHDVGDYKVGDQWRVLEPGMLLTVEPGLYIPADSANVHKKWWNIGIRIEDDVLVTKTGNEVLTAAAPKTVAELELLVGSAYR